MTTLYGFPAMFGAPSASPFVIKADVQLQMLGVDFDRKIADLNAVSKHKMPYVSDNGAVIQDSAFIRWHFERKLGCDLDAGLNVEQRGAAWALERMLEERVYFMVLSERWLVDDNFEKGPLLYFSDVPEAARKQATDEIRAGIRAYLTGMGLMRHALEERMQLADCDIAAVSAVLGDKAFLFGDAPTAVDAVAYGMLASAATEHFDTPLVDLVAKRENLAPYIARMEARFFPEPAAYG